MKNFISSTVVYILIIMMFSVQEANANKVSLSVDINIETSQLKGTTLMDVSAGKELLLLTGDLKIDDILLNSEPIAFNRLDGSIKIIPEKNGELQILYRGIFEESGFVRDMDNPVVDNIIDRRGVSLTNIWYPTTGELANYELKASLPSGYTAISEADTIKQEWKDGIVTYDFHFPYPVNGINLVASDRYEIVKDEYRGIELYAYFFKEDRELAKSYIEFTKKYLKLYEDLVGMYPFKRFSIVENFLPTGYSMPTYTLLGNTVVKLPFIVKTSLGHEILHQWFGNSVYIDYEKGNWAEGLTTYLADHLYRDQKGEGWKYRKEVLVDYGNYVSPETDIPLTFFKGRVDRASRTIGYGKVAMVFHMLKDLVGKDAFFQSLRDLIENNRFTKASWEDIEQSFQKNHDKDLDWFFAQWTGQEGLAELTLHGAEMRQSGREYELHFHVDHEDRFFKLKLPVTFYFKDRMLFETINLNNRRNSFDFILKEKPVRIVLDEDYDVARGLHESEEPPVIAALLGDEQPLLVTRDGDEDIYGKLIDDYKNRGAVQKDVKEVTFDDLENSSLIILGHDNPIMLKMLGSVEPEDAGFYVKTKRNPWNPVKTITLFHGKSRAEVDAAFMKVRHYGKYSKLLFNMGMNRGKEIEETKRGMVMDLEHEATAIEVNSIKTLTDVINSVQNRKIIYVGEIHDVFAHHAVQLDVISGIYKKNPKIAIGMEMFQRPFQETLDSFINGTMGETTFLKESEYFKRWGFDYKLYKPILDFARTEKIPVIALNLRREIINKVSADGIDSLDEKEKKEIPAELDFTDNEYRERLENIFRMHKNSHERDFNNFYQSQILWDETMSSSIDEYLSTNPDYKVIVLAGQGHLRYGSGIPQRTFRRNGQDYAIILIDDTVEEGIADYVVFPKPVEGITSPKLMVFLTVEDKTVTVAGFPEMSVSAEAGLQEEDVILFIDDVKVESVDDLKIHLLYKQKGDIVTLKVLRKEHGMSSETEIEVEL